MNRRIVLAYFGDHDASGEIARLAAAHDADVIAVAIDLGAGTSLNALRDAALAAGAAKCHALDLRDEFAREVIMPAVKIHNGTDWRAAVNPLAREFVAKKLQEIATLEDAAVVPPRPASWMPQPRPGTAAGPAYLEIRFADGEPYALNDVPMTLIELMESIETITGLAAIDVLRLVSYELDHSDEGQVALRVHEGTCSVTSVAAVVSP